MDNGQLTIIDPGKSLNCPTKGTHEMSNCRMVRKLVKPTKAQKEAYKRLVQRDGWTNVSAEDAKLLATCSWLTISQREALTAKFAA